MSRASQSGRAGTSDGASSPTIGAATRPMPSPTTAWTKAPITAAKASRSRTCPERAAKSAAHRPAGPVVGLRDDLGDDGQRDLPRRLAAEVVPRRHVQLVETRHPFV